MESVILIDAATRMIHMLAGRAVKIQCLLSMMPPLHTHLTDTVRRLEGTGQPCLPPVETRDNLQVVQLVLMLALLQCLTGLQLVRCSCVVW
jgi:hypothetical protein